MYLALSAEGWLQSLHSWQTFLIPRVWRRFSKWPCPVIRAIIACLTLTSAELDPPPIKVSASVRQQFLAYCLYRVATPRLAVLLPRLFVDQVIGDCFPYTTNGSNPRNGIRTSLLTSSSALSHYHITPTSPGTWPRFTKSKVLGLYWRLFCKSKPNLNLLWKLYFQHKN